MIRKDNNRNFFVLFYQIYWGEIGFKDEIGAFVAEKNINQ